MKLSIRKKIILLAVFVLIIFRLLLPYIVLNYVNKKLANLSEYYGHVEDIDIALFRGAYVINHIKLEKREEKDSIPFFECPVIDLSVEWKAIFHGKIVGEIYVKDPVLNFVKGKHEGENVKQDTADFKQLIKDLMPLNVNHFEVDNGQVHYIDPYSSPPVDIYMKDLAITANNLTNIKDKTKLLPSDIIASGNAYEGKFKLLSNFDGLNKVPTFDLNAELTDVNLVMMNDFLRAYGNFDVKKGTVGMYMEFAAKDGKLGGYIKPLMANMDIVQWNKEEGDFKQILWETIVATGATILTNRNTGDLGTKIPVNGTFEDSDINIWKAITAVLRNAFVQALKPAIDNTISINNLEENRKKTFLEKVFGKGKEKAKKEEKTKKDR